MKWFKKFEEFKNDELEIETPIDKTPDIAQIETTKGDLDSHIDNNGIVYISDWNKY